MDNITVYRIERLLEQKQISKINFLSSLGYGKNAFSDWKRGFTKSYTKRLPEIAEFLGTTTDYLVGSTDDPSIKKDAPIQMDERKLKILEKYDQLSDENKAVVDAFIEGILLSRG